MSIDLSKMVKATQAAPDAVLDQMVAQLRAAGELAFPCHHLRKHTLGNTCKATQANGQIISVISPPLPAPVMV
jgi:hypothetical protein